MPLKTQIIDDIFSESENGNDTETYMKNVTNNYIGGESPVSEDEDNLDIEDEIVSESEVPYSDEDKCLYKYIDSENSDIDSNDGISDTEDKSNNNDIDEFVPKDERITKPILFKYERVRLLAIRTQQLILGAKPMIKNAHSLSEEEIAKLEIKNRAPGPLYLTRERPDGKVEKWYLSEMERFMD